LCKEFPENKGARMTSYYVEEEETNLEMCLNDNYEEWWHEEYSES